MKTEPMKPIAEMLDEIQGRADAAPSGPWTAEEYDEQQDEVVRDEVVHVAFTNKERKSTTTFIAAARSDIPKLVEALRVAEAALNKYASASDRDFPALVARSQIQAILSKP